MPVIMLLDRLKIDDPIGAFPVHGMGGTWGMISTGLLDMDNGVFYGGAFGDILGPNLVGGLAIIGWTAVTTIPVFIALNTAGLLRYNAAQEIKGLDAKFTPQSPATQAAALFRTGAKDPEPAEEEA
jgi:Amt family ammonium transporter